MSVFNPAIFIGEAVPGSVSGAPLAVDSNGLLVSGLTTQVVTDTANTTTTSGSDVLLTSMTLTPVAGTYMVIFNTSVTDAAAGSAVSFSLYIGGVQDSGSLVKVAPFDGGTLSATSARSTAACIAVETVNGSQSIAVQWSTSSGTPTCGPRRMILLRIV